MFDLEQSIADWQKQMLAAGIQTPVPLEELENHLREEIEMQRKLGPGEEEAFNTAVQKIGKARLIHNEFKKVGKSKRMLRLVMLIFGWLTVNCTLLYCLVGLEFDWNFFNFSIKWNRGSVVEILGIAAAAGALWFLAKASRDKASRAVLLVVAVLMAGFVVMTFPPEKVPSPAPLVINPGENPTGALVRAAIDRALQRHKPSPLWFRGGQSLLVCLPAVFWVFGTRRNAAGQRDSRHGSQPIHSS